MQLFNAASLVDLNIPENVLVVQQEFNEIVNLQFLPRELLEDILNIANDERDWEEGRGRRLSTDQDGFRTDKESMLDRFKITFTDAWTEISYYGWPLLVSGLVIVLLILVISACWGYFNLSIRKVVGFLKR